MHELIVGHSAIPGTVFGHFSSGTWNHIGKCGTEVLLALDVAILLPPWYQQRTAQLFERVEQQMARMADQQSTEAIHLAARTLWSSVHGIAVLAAENKLEVAGDVDEQAMLDSLLENYLNSWAG